MVFALFCMMRGSGEKANPNPFKTDYAKLMDNLFIIYFQQNQVSPSFNQLTKYKNYQIKQEKAQIISILI